MGDEKYLPEDIPKLLSCRYRKAYDSVSAA